MALLNSIPKYFFSLFKTVLLNKKKKNLFKDDQLFIMNWIELSLSLSFQIALLT